MPEVHAALARELARQGVSTLFGVTGEANVCFADCFARQEGGTYVAAATEAGAVIMAKGCSAVTGRLGAATVTHGPGLTNTITALVDGVRDGAPVVLVAGDTAAGDRGNLQNIDQRPLVLATGAGFEPVRAPATARQDMATACRRALAEHRPIVLNVPADFMFQPCEDGVPLPEAAPQTVPGPDGAAVDGAAGVIASSRRPIVLAGHGAIAPGTRAALLALAERIGAPVATTLKGKGLFQGEQADLGIFGTLSSPGTAEAIAQSDCIVAFGASLNNWTTAGGAYLDGKRVVQCDTDPRRLGAHTRIDAGVAGDAAAVARVIMSRLDEAGVAPTGFRATLPIRHPGRSGPGGPDQNKGRGVTDPAGPPALADVLAALDTAVPPGRVLVLDAGRFVLEAFTRLNVADPAWFVPTASFGSIGLGMGHAVGAACAGTGRPVLLVVGDGGFMLGGLAEFNTAVRYGLDVIVAVCNDGSYGAEEAFLRAQGMDPAIARFCWPGFATVADSLGGQGVTVASGAGLRDLPSVIAQRTGPLLLDFRLDPDSMPEMAH